jgi:hypothetical protein
LRNSAISNWKQKAKNLDESAFKSWDIIKKEDYNFDLNELCIKLAKVSN